MIEYTEGKTRLCLQKNWYRETMIQQGRQWHILIGERQELGINYYYINELWKTRQSRSCRDHRQQEDSGQWEEAFQT
jgi:hypothetical protein